MKGHQAVLLHYEGEMRHGCSGAEGKTVDEVPDEVKRFIGA